MKGAGATGAGITAAFSPQGVTRWFGVNGRRGCSGREG